MKKMKKLLVVLSLLVFVGAYTAPAFSIPQDKKVKVTAVDKKATKAEAKAAKSGAKASYVAVIIWFSGQALLLMKNKIVPVFSTSGRMISINSFLFDLTANPKIIKTAIAP